MSPAVPRPRPDPRAPGAGRRRAAGVGLLFLGLAPVAVIAGGVILIGVLMFETVTVVTSKVAAVAAVASDGIAPEIKALETSYGRLATEAATLKDRVDDATKTLASLQDVRIEAGQFGSTGSPQVRIPDKDVAFAHEVVKIKGGELLDKARHQDPADDGAAANGRAA